MQGSQSICTPTPAQWSHLLTLTDWLILVWVWVLEGEYGWLVVLLKCLIHDALAQVAVSTLGWHII